MTAALRLIDARIAELREERDSYASHVAMSPDAVSGRRDVVALAGWIERCDLMLVEFLALRARVAAA